MPTVPVPAPAPAPPPEVRRPRRHAGRTAVKVILIGLAVLLGIAIIVRLILDPIATHETRKALGNLRGFDGDFERVHVTVLPPSYQITHLKVFATEESGLPRSTEPLAYVDRAILSLSLRDLVHGHLLASLRLDRPKLTIVQPPTKRHRPPPNLAPQLARLPPLRLSRVELFDGQLLFIQPTEGEHHPRLWLHDVELTAQNIGTRRKETEARPATIAARARVAKSGVLQLFVSADPLSQPVSFAGEASLRGLETADLYEFFTAHSNLRAPSGTIDLFASFSSKHGMITGGVKPVLKNIEIRSADQGLWDRMKAWLADQAVEMASDRVPERNAVATTIPIKGKLMDPDIQLWPAILGVVRNAFVAGLESGFANLPPPTAEKKEGVLQQTKKALQKNAGPPAAQPTH